MLRHAEIQPIGLDIGHDSVKLLQLEADGNSLRVRAAARQPLEGTARGEEAVDAALESAAAMLDRGGFAGRAVVASLPRDMVHIKNVRLPLIPAAELPAAISFEAKNIFSFDSEVAHVEHLTAGEVRQSTDMRQEVIVMAAKREDVDAFVERLDRVGFQVASLDAEPCALYRSVERFIRRRDDEQEVNVLLDVGTRRTQVLIGRGRELSFYKPIDIGGQRLNEAVSKRLGINLDEARALRRRLGITAQLPHGDARISDARTRALAGANDGQEAISQAVYHATRGTLEELGREVSMCLRYYSVTFRGPGPARVRLMGGEANDPNLSAVLQAVLSIAVEPGHPLRSVDCSAMKPEDRQGTMCEWAKALGLALKKTAGKFAAKDGRPRQTRQGLGEVIDLNQAIAGAADKAPAPEAIPAGGEGRVVGAEGRAPVVENKAVMAEVFRA